MKLGINKQWFRKRLEAVIDNGVWALLVVAVLSGGAIWRFGTHRVALRAWMIVALVAALIAVVIGLLGLLVRVRRFERGGAQVRAATSKHGPLLARLAALKAELDDLNPHGAASWVAADTYNDILQQAQSTCYDPAIAGIAPLRQKTGSTSSSNVGEVLVLIGQVRAILEHDAS